ncbi:hypothetical protein B0T39_20345 [Chromobacterium haemolyticum]|nr:hypothetical protein B0T39_20345 [Chromobacterium haemolyticum]
MPKRLVQALQNEDWELVATIAEELEGWIAGRSQRMQFSVAELRVLQQVHRVTQRGLPVLAAAVQQLESALQVATGNKAGVLAYGEAQTW